MRPTCRVCHLGRSGSRIRRERAAFPAGPTVGDHSATELLFLTHPSADSNRKSNPRPLGATGHRGRSEGAAAHADTDWDSAGDQPARTNLERVVCAGCPGEHGGLEEQGAPPDMLRVRQASKPAVRSTPRLGKPSPLYLL